MASDRKLILSETLLGAVLVPLMLAIGLAGVFLFRLEQQVEVFDSVEHSDQIIAHSHRLENLLIDASSAVRAFAWQGKVSDLEPYRMSVPDIEKALAEFRSILSHDTEQLRRLEQISALYPEWHRSAEETIHFRLERGLPTIPALAWNHGQATLTDIRNALGDLMLEEEKKRDRRVDDSQAATRLTLWSAIVASLLLGGAAAVYSRRQILKVAQAHREAEAALKRGSERLELALEAGQMGTWDYDPVTGERAWSESTLRLYGFRPEEFDPYDSAAIWGRVHPEDREKLRAAIDYAAEHNTVSECEYRVIWPDLSVHWIRARGRWHFDREGRPSRLYGIAYETTATKQAEDALRRSEAHFRILAEAIPPIVWTSDQDGVTDYVNRRWFEYTGTQGDHYPSVDERIASVHPDDLPELLSQRAVALATSEGTSCDCRLRRADGTYRWMLMRSIPLKDDQGRVIRWFGTYTDIHDQKLRQERERFLSEATKAMASSLDYEETLRAIARAGIPILADWCALDALQEDGSLRRIVVASENLEKGKWAKKLESFPPDSGRANGVWNVIQSGTPTLMPEIPNSFWKDWMRDAEHARISGALGVRSILVHPIRARGQILGAISFVMGDSLRRHTEEDLGFARELADRAAIAIENSRLHQETEKAILHRDEFLSIASHELKTPITSLKLQLSLAQKKFIPEQGCGLPAEKIARVLDLSNRQVDRLTGLVDELLDVSKIHAGKFTLLHEELDLVELVKEQLEYFTDQLTAAGCPVEIDAEERVIGRWDRGRIEQVFANLISNAIKYAPGGLIRVSVRADRDGAILTVHDSGNGIPLEKRPRIFDRFERVTSQTKVSGLGLGLYIVRKICEAHGGTVNLDGQAAMGSRFVVELPLDSRAQA